MVDIDWLVINGPCKKYLAGQTIPCPETAAPSERVMYILLTGRVDIYKVIPGESITANGYVYPGEAFGGKEFFTGTGGLTYTAGIESIVYLLTEDTFDALSRARPDVVLEILKAAYVQADNSIQPSNTIPASAEKQKSNSAAPEKPSQAASKKPTQDTSKSAQVSVASSIKATGTGFFPEGHKGYPGITKPEYSKLVYKKEYTCPSCKKKFQDFKVSRSKLYQAAPMRYDLRKFYTGFQTEWYDVITCPHCYYSMHYSYYETPKPFLKAKVEAELAAAKQSITLDFGAERDLDFVFASHYLSLICAPGYISTARQLQAKFWGNLSWLYEDVEDSEMEIYAATKAYEAYELVYMESTLTPVQEQIACLTIAGMMYRAGKSENLRKYLFTAKTTKNGDKAYSNIAEDMMDMLRTEGDN